MEGLERRILYVINTVVYSIMSRWLLVIHWTYLQLTLTGGRKQILELEVRSITGIISSHIVEWNPFLSTNKPTFLARKGEIFLGTN